jgi:hypothetical protein
MLNRSGQLVAVIPLSVSLAIGGLLMWGYQESAHHANSDIRTRSAADRFANLAISRLKILATRQLPTAGACNTAFGAGLSALRDLGNESPAALTLTFTHPTVATWVNCVFTSAEVAELTAAIDGPIRNLDVEIARLSRPDLETFTAFLTVTARVVTRPIGNSAVRSFTLRENVRLQAASLSRYAVVLRHPSDDAGADGGAAITAGTQLSVSGGSSLEILGETYRAGDQGAAVDLNSIVDTVNAPNVILHGRLDVQADRLSIGSGLALDISTFNSMLRKGIREKIFGAVNILPIRDGLPAAFSNNNGAWNHFIRYSPDPTRRSQPLAFVGNQAADVPISVPAWSVAAAEQWPSASPDPLNDTCDTSSATNKFYVRINFDQDLTLTPAHFGTNNSFCGVIAANRVVIDTGSGSDKLFLGQIVARQILVSGSSKLTISHPGDNIAVLSPSPSPDPADIFRRYQELILLHAHNFNVPILQNAAAIANAAYRPSGAIITDPTFWLPATWVGPFPATNPAFPPVGYMIQCYDADGAGPAPRFFCPRLNPAGLPAATRQADLAGGLAGQLVFE